MNIYNYLFVNYYEFALYFGNEANSTLFRKAPEGTCFIITTLQVFNIITFWLLLGLKKFTGVFLVDIALCTAIFYSLNYLIFLKKKKYKKILEKAETDKEIHKSIGFWFSLLYAIGTFIFFYYVYKNEILI